MTKRVKGSRRLKLIQDYLNGKEDDDYEVLPTKKEGKYIIKPRKPKVEKQQVEEQKIEIPKVEEPKVEVRQVEKPKVQEQVHYDPTINIEILNQLKLLGEEIKQKREKKEQKRMIKEVVHKQMMKPKYTIPTYIQEPNEIQETQDEEVIQQKPIIFRRRNTIFSDIY